MYLTVLWVLTENKLVDLANALEILRRSDNDKGKQLRVTLNAFDWLRMSHGKCM
jgi:hypothetical protein